MNGQEQKQTAMVLDLSEQLVKELDELHTRLDESFDRTPDTTKPDEGKPSLYNNVLDEVLDNLKYSAKQAQRLHDRIIQEIVAKIHQI